MFSENEEQLLTQSLEQVMDIDKDPEETLLRCFTHSPVDEEAKIAWSEKRGAVPSDDRPLQIGNVGPVPDLRAPGSCTHERRLRGIPRELTSPAVLRSPAGSTARLEVKFQFMIIQWSAVRPFQTGCDLSCLEMACHLLLESVARPPPQTIDDFAPQMV